MWLISPVRGFSASTRTPTSIEVRHAAFTDALQREQVADVDGLTNVIRSTPAVTTRRRRGGPRRAPAASSHSFITVPPCTNPAALASVEAHPLDEDGARSADRARLHGSVR